MSVYATTKDTEYVLNLNKTDNAYYCDCNEAIINRERKLLHNEVGFSFIFIDGKFKQLGGWHIGTEDFEFGEMEDWVLEYYHPGITEQVIKKAKEIKEV